MEINEKKQNEPAPLVSVIVPVYNKEKTLPRTLRSLAGQVGPEGSFATQTPRALRGPFAEVILVDDGSTDRSVEVIRQFLDTCASDGPSAEADANKSGADDVGALEQVLSSGQICFRLIRQENAGVSAARNTGLLQATGKYITFMDADDWAEPDWLASMTEAAEKYAADEVICGVEFHKKNRKKEVNKIRHDRVLRPGRVYGDTFRRDRLQCNCTNKLFRAECVQGKIWYDPAYPIGEDLKFCTEAFPFCGKYVRIKGVKYHYDTAGDGAMNRMKQEPFRKEWLSEWRAVRAVAEIWKGLPEERKGTRRDRKCFIRDYRVKQLAVALKIVTLLESSADNNTDEALIKAEKELTAFIGRNRRYLVYFRQIGKRRILQGFRAVRRLSK